MFDPDVRYIDERDLSVLICTPIATLRTWRRRRQGPPFVKFSRSVRYSTADIRAWIRERTVATSKP